MDNEKKIGLNMHRATNFQQTNEEKERKLKRKNYISNFKHNTLNAQETKKVIKETLNFVSDSISPSLGPYGSNTIIQDTELQHITTKDGYTILSRLSILEAPHRAILDLVRRISKNLVKEVGDGSSSCVVISNKLYSELLDYKRNNFITDVELLDSLKKAKNEIINELYNFSKKVDSLDIIENIATISSNNDNTIGKFVREIFTNDDGNLNKELMFHIDLSRNEDFSFEKLNGYEHNRGFVDYSFAKEFKDSIIEFENPLIFMCDDYLRREDLQLVIELINNYIVLPMQQKKPARPLIFIAKGYDKFILDIFIANKQQYGSAFPLAAIDIATGTKNALDKFEDLAIFLGAKPLSKLNNEQYQNYDQSGLGECKKIIISENSTKFIEGNINTEKAERLVELLTKELDDLQRIETPFDTTEKEYFLQKRIATLSKNFIKINVGGFTEIEKKTYKYLLEDALLACKSALKNGYTIGGNLAVPACIDNILNKNTYYNDKYKELLEIIKKSFLYAYWKILLNYYEFKNREKINNIIENSTKPLNYKIYNLLNKEYEDLETTTVINPVNTEIEILNATFSIIGLLANSNQFISVALL